MKRVVRRVLLSVVLALPLIVVFQATSVMGSNPYPNEPQLSWMSESEGEHTIALSVAAPSSGTYAGTFKVYASAAIPSGTPEPLIELTITNSGDNKEALLESIDDSTRFSAIYTPASGESSLDETTWTNLEAKCAPGRYSNSGRGPCTLATPGRYVATRGSTTDVACPLGTFQSSSGAMTCLLARAGYYVDSMGANSDEPCALGTFAPDPGSIECLLAGEGTYVPAEGRSSALPCSVGSVQPLRGQSQCNETSPGFFASETGLSIALPCPPGTYQPNEGETECLLSAPGYKVTSPGSATPTACSAGTFSTIEGATTCINAQPGTYVAETGWREALPCAAGSYQPNYGATSCMTADIGFYVGTTGAINQDRCAEGTASKEKGATACVSTATPTPETPATVAVPIPNASLVLGESMFFRRPSSRSLRGAQLSLRTSSKDVCSVVTSRRGFTVTGRSDGTCKLKMTISTAGSKVVTSIPMTIDVQTK